MANAVSPRPHQYVGHGLIGPAALRPLTDAGTLCCWVSMATARQVRVGDRQTNERTNRRTSPLHKALRRDLMNQHTITKKYKKISINITVNYYSHKNKNTKIMR